MSTRPRIPSPIRPRRCSRWSREVEDYPKFLPLCEALEVKRREEREGKEVLVATMTVGYGMIHESFTTKVHLDRAARTILVEYLDGPFTFLENRWHFQPTGAERVRGRVLYRLCLPLAPVRAAGGRAVRQGGRTIYRAPSRRAPMRSMGAKTRSLASQQ